MKYDYASILKELKSLKSTEEKRKFAQRVINQIKLSEAANFSDIPASRIEHLKKRINYLEDMFILRNILIESYLNEKSWGIILSDKKTGYDCSDST